MLRRLWKRWNKEPETPSNTTVVAGRVIEVVRLDLEPRLLLLFASKDLLYGLVHQQPLDDHIGQLTKLVSDTTNLTEDWLKTNLTLEELLRLFFIADRINGFIEATPYMVMLGWVKNG